MFNYREKSEKSQAPKNYFSRFLRGITLLGSSKYSSSAPKKINIACLNAINKILNRSPTIYFSVIYPRVQIWFVNYNDSCVL